MAGNTMHVEIVELDGRVWAGEATSVFARTQSGEIGILPGHAPLAALLTETGIVKINTVDEGVIVLAAHGGGMTVQSGSVTLLAESAEMVSEIDADRAQAALDRARAAEESAETKAAEQRALTRLSLAGSGTLTGAKI